MKLNNNLDWYFDFFKKNILKIDLELLIQNPDLVSNQTRIGFSTMDRGSV
jgi:hypothetical protein